MHGRAATLLFLRVFAHYLFFATPAALSDSDRQDRCQASTSPHASITDGRFSQVSSYRSGLGVLMANDSVPAHPPLTRMLSSSLGRSTHSLSLSSH
ncbi:hypothetical protein BaRGS_00018504 [Batillaria attramentaria]|uniref:Secreted protein n=1 Tax=Batillaria attramentaria TaxID=370345 RepID=A0ABD0KSE9_9CAEN